MYDWDLQVVPGPPEADLKRRVLEEWLNNPFLDDDTASLSFRLGAAVPDVTEALRGLCDAGFLQPAGSGYGLALALALALDLDLGDTLPGAGSPASSAGADDEPSPTSPSSGPASQAAVELASLSGAVVADPEEEEEVDGPQSLTDEDQALHDLLSADDRVDALAREIEHTLTELLPDEPVDEGQLLDALPFGLLVLRPTGAAELVNARAAEMLGVPRDDLDGATFEIATCVNPLTALDTDEPLLFSLTEPRAMEVSLHGRRQETGAVVVILIRDVSLLEEVSHIQAEVQEDLFRRLQADMVQPLATIESFLEAPDTTGLVRARVAMEQVNWFLQEFFLRSVEDDRSRDGAGD